MPSSDGAADVLQTGPTAQVIGAKDQDRNGQTAQGDTVYLDGWNQ